MTVAIAATRELAVSQQQAWDAMVDWPTQRHWMPLTRVMVDDDAGRAHYVGARFVARTGFGPLSFADPMQISQWEPPTHCEVLHHGRVVRGTGWFDVRALGDRRCVVGWGERLEVPFGAVGAIGWRLVAPAVRLGLRVALRRFARNVGG